MDGNTGDPIQERLYIGDLGAFQRRMTRKHLFFRRLKHAVEAPEHREGQNDPAILGGLIRTS